MILPLSGAIRQRLITRPRYALASRFLRVPNLLLS